MQLNLREPHKPTTKIPLAPPWEGPSSCEGYSVIPFPMCYISYAIILFSASRFAVLVSGSLVSVSRILELLLPGPRDEPIQRPSGGARDLGWPQNKRENYGFFKFQASLQGNNKSHENWSQHHPKSWNVDPGIIRNPGSVEITFCNTSDAKYWLFESQTSRFGPKNHQKPRNKHVKIHLFCARYTNNSVNAVCKSKKNQ